MHPSIMLNILATINVHMYTHTLVHTQNCGARGTHSNTLILLAYDTLAMITHTHPIAYSLLIIKPGLLNDCIHAHLHL